MRMARRSLAATGGGSSNSTAGRTLAIQARSVDERAKPERDGRFVEMAESVVVTNQLAVACGGAATAIVAQGCRISP
jgi:hypothetical protein